MKTVTTHSILHRALAGQRKTIRIGRSAHTAGMGSGTPVQLTEGSHPPVLTGLPYLKTTFRNGSFTRTLYTPSTLHVTVGREWLRNRIAAVKGVDAWSVSI